MLVTNSRPSLDLVSKANGPSCALFSYVGSTAQGYLDRLILYLDATQHLREVILEGVDGRRGRGRNRALNCGLLLRNALRC